MFKKLFWGVLNNGTNTNTLTSANISKWHCVIHFNTLIPYILRLKVKLKVRSKNNWQYYNTKRRFALVQAVSKSGPMCSISDFKRI